MSREKSPGAATPRPHKKRGPKRSPGRYQLPPIKTHVHERMPVERAPTPRGARPRVLTEQIADRICRRIMLGEALKDITEDPRMPSIGTFTRWLAAPENAAFRERYHNARRVQAELRIDEIFSIADDSSRDYKPVYDNDGNVIRMDPDNEHIQRSRVRIDTRKWFASKMLPRIYGEKVVNELDVSGDLADLLKKASNRDKGLPPARGRMIEHDE